MGVVGLAFFAGSCSLIDEQLVNCPEDIIVDYHVRLITNKAQEMDLKLGTDKDLPLRMALEDYLRDIFVETARDADLSFYSQSTDERTIHFHDIWNAAERSYSLQVFNGGYSNIVAANVDENSVVRLAGDESSAASSLAQNAADVVPSHNTGIFTARKLLQVVDDHRLQQHFDVDLFMANDAGGLLLNVDECDFTDVRCEIEGLADGFKLLDSTYTYGSHTLVKTDLINVAPTLRTTGPNAEPIKPDPLPVVQEWDSWSKTPVILCGVGFPSRIDSDKKVDNKPVYWVMHLYVTLENGSVTKSTIYVAEPLYAAHLKLIKGWLLGDGSFSPEPPGTLKDMLAGVDVQLDWTPGPQFDPML